MSQFEEIPSPGRGFQGSRALGGLAACKTLASKFSVLLRAGATIPPDTQDPYLLKVRSAGDWGRYERAFRARLAKILERVVFPGLPTDTVSHVVHFAFHTGYY